MSSDALHQNTITVFNYHKRTGVWYPTVITGVHITAADSSTHGTLGTANADSVKVQIMCGNARCVFTPDGGKSYTTPKVYEKSWNPDRVFTFAPECDFFVVGACNDLDPVEDDDFVEGFYHAMNSENDGVYLINRAAYFSLIPHFEIGGR